MSTPNTTNDPTRNAPAHAARLALLALATIATTACGGGGGGSSAAGDSTAITGDAGTTAPDDGSTTTLALPYAIVDTGQTITYGDLAEITPPAAGAAYFGQDAQHTGNTPSYTDNGDGTVSDNVTGLMWQQSPDRDGNGSIDAADKLSYAEALAGAASLTLAGHSDWRLPTIKELYSLINFSGVDPDPSSLSTTGLTPFLDSGVFGFAYGDTGAGERIIDSQWATSTLYVSTVMFGERAMFGVNFADGRIKGYPADPMPGLGTAKTYYVLYVRGNTAYGVNDFANNGDGTISDRATGLMWARDDSGSAMNWGDALAWIVQKNSENYLGHADWRLPDAKELHSIVDYTRSPDTTASAAIDPLFNVSVITNKAGTTDYPFYWSSTTHLNGQGGGSAVYVAFGEALGYFPDASNTYSFIDVHGAGAQRSDPKVGTPSYGNGPQGDVRRVYNHVRAVRTIGQ
jgi:hypothetical protein